MSEARRPSLAAVRSAAATLSRATALEAARIRKEQGSGGHVAAQELDRLAISIGGLASRIEALRQAER